MTPTEITSNEDIVNDVADAYMTWNKQELVGEILEFMSVNDLKKVAQDFQVSVNNERH